MSDMNARSSLPGILLRISGQWAHFKKPETNNNPLTHDFITKTALLGLMGAVLGVERREMRELFPKWSEGLLYGVQVLTTVKKESWSFTMREVGNQNNKAPRPMEVLRSPRFLVALASYSDDTVDALQEFTSHLEQSRACYTPVLGLHNCPAELELLQKGGFVSKNGSYKTKGFALMKHNPDTNLFNEPDDFRLGLEKIPTYQNNDFWNRPDRYAEVCYADEDREISLKTGDYFKFDDSSTWCLI